MHKYLIFFLCIFFLRGTEPAYSQAAGDSVETYDINPYSLYRLKAGSGYQPSNPIRKVDRNQVKSFLLNPDYAYANDPEYWKKQTPPRPGIISRILNSAFMKWTLLLAVIGVVLYGIYQLAKENNFNWFSRTGKQNQSETLETVSGEEMDYDTAIRKYQAEGNYRLAVRCMYIRLIHTVREKTGISFRDSSTNAEIARAFGTHPLAGDFRFLAMAYEYIYYGGFIPRKELFESIKSRFDAFQQNLSV
jgi:hypothetical protein